MVEKINWWLQRPCQKKGQTKSNDHQSHQTKRHQEFFNCGIRTEHHFRTLGWTIDLRSIVKTSLNLRREKALSLKDSTRSLIKPHFSNNGEVASKLGEETLHTNGWRRTRKLKCERLLSILNAEEVWEVIKVATDETRPRRINEAKERHGGRTVTNAQPYWVFDE